MSIDENGFHGDNPKDYNAEIPGEKALVINGISNFSHNFESREDFGSIGCFKGREVRKMFEGQYFSGKVVEFDKETSWYKIVYEDGDSEELDFQELQDILLPIESEIPQKQIAFHVYQSSKSSPKFCRKESMSSPTARKSSKKGPPLLSLEQHLHIHPLVKRKGKRSSERRNPCWGKVHEKDPNTSIEACIVSSFQTQKRSQDAAIKLSTETPFTLFDKTKGVPTRVTSKNRKRKRNGSKKSSISTKSLQKDPMITTESDKRLPEKISSEKNPQEVPIEVYNELEAAPVPENQISIDQNPQLCNQVTECNTCHQQGGDTCVKASIISGEHIGPYLAPIDFIFMRICAHNSLFGLKQ